MSGGLTTDEESKQVYRDATHMDVDTCLLILHTLFFKTVFHAYISHTQAHTQSKCSSPTVHARHNVLQPLVLLQPPLVRFFNNRGF